MQTQDAMREKTFNMRMSDEDWEQLQAIADYRKMTAAEFLRRSIREEYRDISIALFDRASGKAVEPQIVLEQAAAANWNSIRPEQARALHERFHSFTSDGTQAWPDGDSKPKRPAKKAPKK